jgi:hypothetical protein
MAEDETGSQMITESSTVAPPMVSVVMTAFNGERFLRQAVDSILSQTFRDFEFIIIDDGSTDATASILYSYAGIDRRVQVYQQENRGLVDSLNRGCGLAQGKYIAIMDHDDIALPYRLERQVAYMERHPQIVVLGGGFEMIDASGCRLSTFVQPSTDPDIRNTLRQTGGFQHSTVVMRREAFSAVKGYRKPFRCNADHDLSFRLLESYQGANLPEVLVCYRIHSGQVSISQVRRQVVEGLVARAAASIRAAGGPDPLWQVDEITPDLLKALRITDTEIQKALVSTYSGRVSLLWRASQAAAALQAFNDLLELAPLQEIPKRAAADARLAEACIRYRQGRPLRALVSAGRAVLTRPIIVSRPARRALRWLGKSFLK